MGKTREKLMIIDGNALIHRSFHALPPTMTTKTGEPTNAVYGFAVVLLKAIKEFKPGYVVLTLDSPGPTFRHKQYKEYKATRVKAPDELYAQIPRVRELAEAFGIPVFAESGFEADDLIGTIATKVNDETEKIIVTGDMDTMQLVNGHTKVYTMSRGLTDSVLYDEEAVKARYGLAPDQMLDYKALRGDPSDNIPGVKGIGEKTATELLIAFNTLGELYENIEAQSKKAEGIRPRIIELLKLHKKEAYLSKKLATIKRDVKINFKLETARFGQFDQNEVVKLLSDLEFKSLLPRVQTLLSDRQSSQTKEERQETILDKFARNKKEFKYRLVSDEKEFMAFLRKLKLQKQFAFDTETTGFDPLTAELLGISFSWQTGEAYYLKIKNEELRIKNAAADNLFNYSDKSSKKKNGQPASHPWLSALKPIMEDKKILKCGHNIKFDIKTMMSAGIRVAGVYFDTMIASYLLNPGTRQHNLDAVTFSEFGHEKITKDDLLGKGRERIGFAEVDTEKLALYSCEDADFTNRLVKKLAAQLKEKKSEKLFFEIEMPLIPVLVEMELKGIKVDKRILFNISKKITKKLNELEKKIYRQAGAKFNINSTQQLREILFEKLDIPTETVSKIKTGLSTAADELNKLKSLHPIIRSIQEHRELTKLATTYVDALPDLINEKTGRLHTSFNQTITATGRLSSTEPNLQNIPVRTELGREIRQAFVAADGFKFLSLDYSQIELRLAAHMSDDRKMIRAFKDGADIHTATAAEINRIDAVSVSPEQRREAKAINFGILYGQGPHGLAQTADIPYARAREFIEKYFTSYRNVKNFIDSKIAEARERGYAETLFVRRRYLPEINSSVIQVRKAAERMAVNTPLQGTAADMIKIAMIGVQGMIGREYRTGEVRMLLQVHDELLFEVKSAKMAEVAEKIKEIMENVIKLKVPIIVDIKTGDNWGELDGFRIKN